LLVISPLVKFPPANSPYTYSRQWPGFCDRLLC